MTSVSDGNTALEVRRGKDPRTTPSKLRERLWEAVQCGDVEEVKRVLALVEEDSVCAANQRGETALHVAASSGFAEVAECLLKASADVNARNKSLQTPLHKAAYEGHTEAVTVLLAVTDVHVNAANELGMTALHWAAARERVQVCEQLLAAGADMDLTDENGNTACNVAQGDTMHLFATGPGGGDSALDFATGEDSGAPLRTKMPLFKCSTDRHDLPLPGVRDPMMASRQCQRKCEACVIA